MLNLFSSCKIDSSEVQIEPDITTISTPPNVNSSDEPPPDPPLEKKKTPFIYSDQIDEALFQAIDTDNLNKALDLLKQGANPNQTRKSRVQINYVETPLFVAVSNTALAEALLKVGADVNIGHYKYCEQNNICENWSPLDRAVSGDNLDTAKILVKYGAKVEDKLIHNTKSEEMIAYLVELKVDINYPLLNGDTHLMRSAFFDDIKVVKALIKYGADVHIKNNAGDNALFFAKQSKYKDKEMIEIIKEAMKKQK